MADRTYRKEIDGIRAIAVMFVVAFHAGIERIGLRFGWRLAEGGYIGVDVFYVLSGFLITGLLVSEVQASGAISLGRFYARRIRRLLPLVALVIVATLIAGFALWPAIDWPALSLDALTSAGYVANLRFAAAATQYLADNPSHSPFLHFWSLSLEEQFYLFWPAIVAGVAWWTSRSKALDSAGRFVGALATLTTLGVLASFAASIALSSSSPPWAYFGLHTRAWELGLGALVMLHQPAWRRLPSGVLRLLGWAGLLAVITSGLFFTRDTTFPGYAASVPTLGTALMLVGSEAALGPSVGRLLSFAPLRYVGRVSYAWYLWHWPCVMLVGPAVGAVERPTALATLGAVAVSFLAAVMSHHLVENTTRHRPELAQGFWPFGLATSTVALTALALLSTRLIETDHALIATTDPAFARRDRVRQADGCTQDYAGTAASVCPFGGTTGKPLVLMGDSHAEAWLPAFDGFAKEHGYRGYLFSKGACPPFDVPRFLPNYRRAYRECDEWRAHVLATLTELRPAMVVIARFGTYASSLLEADGTHAMPERVALLWQAGAARTFAALAPVTSRIVVMRDVPKPGNDVPVCLSRHGASCAFDVTDGLRADAPLFDAEGAAAQGRPNVTFVDLTKDICESSPCPVRTSDGTIKYRDTNHLTASFSRQLAGALALRLREP